MGGGLSKSLFDMSDVSTGDALINVTYVGDEMSITQDHAKTPVRCGWMEKRGQMVTSWNRRYFELHQSGKLAYYTDESKEDRKGIVDLKVIIGLNFYDRFNNRFEVITPKRVWCFGCDHTSECHQWMESMKYIEHSNVLNSVQKPSEHDYVHLSANGSLLKLLAKMGPPEGEKILYSDRIMVAITKNKEPQKTKEMIVMLTSDAVYHFPLNDNYKKCDYRIPWKSVEFCIVLNPAELSIDDAKYSMDPRNMKPIVDILSDEVEMKCNVLFENDEDEVSFRGGAQGSDQVITSISTRMSCSASPLEMKQIHDPDSTVPLEEEMKEIHDLDPNPTDDHDPNDKYQVEHRKTSS